jgi:protein TonB
MIRPFAALAAAAALAACRQAPVAQTAPRQLVPPPFEYPEELWDAGVQGETVLRIRVNEQGRVDSVRVEKASGHKGFDSAAVAGTPRLRFAPATRGGGAVPAWVLLPVDFHLAPARAGDTTRPASRTPAAARDTAGTS